MKNILFMDVDGVVIKGFHLDPKYRKPWYADLEIDLKIHYDDLVEHFFKKKFGDITSGKKDLLEELNRVLPLLNYSGTSKDFIEYWFSKDSHIDRELLDKTDRLRKTASLSLYLATNQEKYRANYLWNDLGLKNHYDGMFFSGDFKITKEHPQFYEMINKRLGVNPKTVNILFFDDRPDFLNAAKAAGWKAYLYNTIDDFTQNEHIKLM